MCWRVSACTAPQAKLVAAVHWYTSADSTEQDGTFVACVARVADSIGVADLPNSRVGHTQAPIPDKAASKALCIAHLISIQIRLLPLVQAANTDTSSARWTEPDACRGFKSDARAKSFI